MRLIPSRHVGRSAKSLSASLIRRRGLDARHRLCYIPSAGSSRAFLETILTESARCLRAAFEPRTRAALGIIPFGMTTEARGAFAGLGQERAVCLSRPSPRKHGLELSRDVKVLARAAAERRQASAPRKCALPRPSADKRQRLSVCADDNEICASRRSAPSAFLRGKGLNRPRARSRRENAFACPPPRSETERGRIMFRRRLDPARHSLLAISLFALSPLHAAKGAAPHCAVRPPSSTNSAPVTKADSSASR